MAIVTRTYVVNGPTNGDLHKYVDPTANVNERLPVPVVIVDIDDSTSNIVETLDQYMQSIGYDFFDGNQKLQIFQRPGNPGAVAGRAIIYAISVAGVTQLMCRASNGTITQLTPLQLAGDAVSGLVPSWTSGTTITIGAGQARNHNDQSNIVLAAPQLVNAAIVGANGLDAGALANNTFYFIFVISDSTGVLPTAGLISTVSGAPAMPAGYDTRRRIGSVRTNGGATFRDFQVDGTQRHRSTQYRDAISGRQRLTGGAAVVVTAVSLGQFVPNTSSFARIQVQQRGPVAASLYDDPTQLLANAQRTVLANGSLNDVMRVSAARDIAYANAGAGGLLDIWVTGYEEDL